MDDGDVEAGPAPDGVVGVDHRLQQRGDAGPVLHAADDGVVHDGLDLGLVQVLDVVGAGRHGGGRRSGMASRSTVCFSGLESGVPEG